jgi:CheY-like chemotaxis protein
LREEAGLRSQPEPFDGRYEAALRAEPAAGSRAARGNAHTGLRLYPVSEGRESSEGRLGAVRVALVEDNKVFREALELLLGLRSDVDVVASVEDGNDVVALCKDHEPDVVVMDYRLPGLDGVQATAALRQACPEVAVVCLTASANPREMEALQAAGAVACLTKDRELDEIVDAIRTAAGR